VALSINLVSHSNGRGLTRDMDLLEAVLRDAGHEVSRSDVGAWRGIFRRYDVNLFLELLEPHWFGSARANCLIPNQEWFHAGWLPILPHLRLVLAKTRHAEALFRARGARTEYLGFTSADRLLDDVPKSEQRWLHIAGRSAQKGTEVIRRTWLGRPHYPHLTLIQHGAAACGREAPNLEVIEDFLPDACLRILQNACGVHLCPSEAEGFGHTIAEAMSTGALVLTTDAPPMNEFVTRERGVLCGVGGSGPQHLGTRYATTEAALAAAVDELLALPAAARVCKRAGARAWFDASDEAFRARLVEIVGRL
jgi:hypothetical protein